MKYLLVIHYSLDAPLIKVTVGPFDNTKAAERWAVKTLGEDCIWQICPMVMPNRIAEWSKSYAKYPFKLKLGSIDARTKTEASQWAQNKLPTVRDLSKRFTDLIERGEPISLK